MEDRKKNKESLWGLTGSNEQTEDQIKMSEARSKVAAEHGIESVTAVALAYVMSKAPNVLPIVGGRKVEHLRNNIQALKIKLINKQIECLESIKPLDVGFPSNFIGEDPHITSQNTFILGTSAKLSFVQAAKAIGHE